MRVTRESALSAGETLDMESPAVQPVLTPQLTVKEERVVGSDAVGFGGASLADACAFLPWAVPANICVRAPRAALYANEVKVTLAAVRTPCANVYTSQMRTPVGCRTHSPDTVILTEMLIFFTLLQYTIV